MPDYETDHRVRYFVFTEEDERRYFALLAEAFPTMRVMDEPINALVGEERPPPVLVHSSIAECRRGQIEIIFDADWQPVWGVDRRYIFWSLNTVPFPNGLYLRGGGVLPAQERSRQSDVEGPAPEELLEGRINLRARRGVESDRKTISKAMRLMAKVASNRNIMTVRFPSLEVIGRFEKGYMLWVGHDAREWAREDSRRMLSYNPGVKIGIRPMD